MSAHRQSDEKARNKGVFRRAHQYRQLSGLGSDDHGGRGDRSGARLRFPQRQGRLCLRRRHSGASQKARREDRPGAGDPRACRPSVGRALYQAQDRRQGLDRRAHPRRAAHLPPGVQRHRRVGRRLRIRPSVQGWRALQDRHARRRGDPHARPYAGLRVLSRSATRSLSATPCSCRTTAPRAPIFPAAMPARSIVRSSASCRCRPRRGCSCATTTRRPAAILMPGRPRSARSARAMCMCTKA